MSRGAHNAEKAGSIPAPASNFDPLRRYESRWVTVPETVARLESEGWVASKQYAGGEATLMTREIR